MPAVSGSGVPFLGLLFSSLSNEGLLFRLGSPEHEDSIKSLETEAQRGKELVHTAKPRAELALRPDLNLRQRSQRSH